MNFKAVFNLLGRLFLLIGGLLLLPAAVSYYYGEMPSFRHFLYTSFGVSALAGFLLFLCWSGKDEGIRVRDGFLLVTLAWVGVSFAGSIPFYLSGFFPSISFCTSEEMAEFPIFALILQMELIPIHIGSNRW